MEVALEAVRAAYASKGAPEALQVYVEPGCGHECTDSMWQQVSRAAAASLVSGGGRDGGLCLHVLHVVGEAVVGGLRW